MTKRNSIYIGDFSHSNPIPNACRIGGIIASALINGVDPATGKVAPTLPEQCRFMFQHMKSIVEAGGGTTDDIVKMTVWLKDRSQRGPLNEEWLKFFPDKNSRPARHTMRGMLEGDVLVQCDFLAVLGSGQSQ